MEFKKLAGKIKIPVLGFGTYGLGGEFETDTTHDKEGISAIKTAISLGITHIDTAEMYGAGHAEELVGKAIAGLDRKKLFITTKVLPENLRYDDVISSAKESLKRLKSEYIDLYLIHVPNPKIPIEETMKAMDFLVEKKIVKFIGVSNFSVEQIKEAQKHAKNKIVANELRYSLWSKSNDLRTIKYCQDNGIIVIAHKPLGRGKIATEKIPLLADLAKKYKKTEAQVVLNWLISKKNIVTIFKAIRTEHIKENLGAIGWKLKQEDIKKLDKEVPR